MATTVVSSISKTGTPDYSTPQLWEDAAPVNLVTADQVWQGVIDKTTDNYVGGSVVINLAGSTTDATRYKELTVKAGASFVDHASPKLAYDTAKGASIEGTGSVVATQEPYGRYSRIQILATTSIPITIQGSNSIIDSVLAQVNGTGAGGNIQGSGQKFTNCVFINDSPSTGGVSFSTVAAGIGDFINCLFVRPSDDTTAVLAFTGSIGGTLNLVNCGIYGATTLSSASVNVNYTTCASDKVSPPAGVTTISYANADFVSDLSASFDFRINTGSSLKDAGSTDTRAALDIFGTARPEGSNYDIGVHEFVPTVTINVTITPSGKIDFLGTNSLTFSPAKTVTYIPTGDITFFGSNPLGPPRTIIFINGVGSTTFSGENAFEIGKVLSASGTLIFSSINPLIVSSAAFSQAATRLLLGVGL